MFLHPLYYALERADAEGDWVTVGYRLHREGNGGTILAAGIPKRVGDKVYISIGRFQAAAPIKAHHVVMFRDDDRVSPFVSPD